MKYSSVFVSLLASIPAISTAWQTTLPLSFGRVATQGKVAVAREAKTELQATLADIKKTRAAKRKSRRKDMKKKRGVKASIEPKPLPEGQTAYDNDLESTIQAKIDAWVQKKDELMAQLDDMVNSVPNFYDDLMYSLAAANDDAQVRLDRPLYDVLGDLTWTSLDGTTTTQINGWPLDYAGYKDFLSWYAKYTPQQSDLPAWSDPATGISQQVFDHLCHFYWLVDQDLSDSPSGVATLQEYPGFANWLVDYANLWGAFCDSQLSISQKTIKSFVDYSPNFNVTDSMIPWNEELYPEDGEDFPPDTIFDPNGVPLRPNNPSGWKTWNQFFARQLNGGLRPIDDPEDNTVICSTADCTFMQMFPIDEEGNVIADDGDGVVIKNGKIGNVRELLAGSDYADAFDGGTYMHFFLAPYSYHRFRTPVKGEIKECFPVPGRTYLDVVIMDNGQFDAPDYANDGYEFIQSRGILTIDTTESDAGNVGIVAAIPVGMAQVSGVSMTATPGPAPKGAEFGFFTFGGSDNALLFQKGVNPTLFDTVTGDSPDTDGAVYNLVSSKVGTAHLLPTPVDD